MSISAPELLEKKREADRADFGKDYDREIEIYRGLMQTELDANQRQFVRLLLAGALMRAWRSAEANAIYLEVLNLSSDVVDEYGLSLALHRDGYATGALLTQRKPDLDRAVLDRIDREISSLPALARSEDSLKAILTEIAKSSDASVRLNADKTLKLLKERMAYVERMRAMPETHKLRDAFAGLGVTTADWRTFGSMENVWLVGMITALEAPPLVIAIRAEDIRRRIEADRELKVAFSVGCQDGDSLGATIPGLCVILPQGPPIPPPGIGLPVLFALALALVGVLLPVCLWLVWRDTRREVRLADLRSQFVSSVSHELKTPLTAIRMFAETMQVRSDERKRDEYLNIIVNESERLTRLLNNILDFSRIERGQKIYNLQPGTLADVIQSAARTMRFPLSAQGFDLRVELADNVPPTPIDRDAMEQAVLNLLSNAMKYSGESRDIALRLSRQNGTALIQVVDNGVGIPADEQKRIFERFYRVQTSENFAISGTGLGLALVAHIAEAHGGSVDVDSVVGRGSTFSIRLPLTDGGTPS